MAGIAIRRKLLAVLAFLYAKNRLWFNLYCNRGAHVKSGRPLRVAVATCGGYRVNQSMNEGNDNGIRHAVPVTALLLLCFLWSLGSLRSDLMPTIFAGGLPTFEREAIHLGALAVVAWLIALVTRAAWPRGRQIWDAILIGLGLFAVPAFFGEAAKDESRRRSWRVQRRGHFDFRIDAVRELWPLRANV